MGRQKVTVSLSTKCLQLIDTYAETTGFEARSRVLEEAIFAITELLAYRQIYNQKIQPTIKPNPSQEEVVGNFILLMDILSKWGGILDRFQRFPVTIQTHAETSVKYRKVPPEEHPR